MNKKLIIALFACINSIALHAFLGDIGQGLATIGEGVAETTEAVVSAPFEIIAGEPADYYEVRRHYYGPARPAFYPQEETARSRDYVDPLDSDDEDEDQEVKESDDF